MRHLMTIGFALVILLAIVLAAAEQAPQVAAQGPVVARPIIGYAVKAGVSPRLRDIPPGLSEGGSLRVIAPRRAASSQVKLPSRIARDPVVQNNAGRINIPAPIRNFEGTSNADNQSVSHSRFWPPDTNGDIGFDPSTGKKYYVQGVNIAYQVWDVTSVPVSISGPVDFEALWTTLGPPCSTLTSIPSSGDIIVLFDSMAHRWLASVMAQPNDPNGPFHQCVAISKTADPTGQYWLYDFIVSNTLFNDYPKWAVWPDGYYLSVNQFDQNGNGDGVGAYVFDRTSMLSGGSPVSFQYFNLPNQYSMLPSNLNGSNLPPAGSPNYYVQLGYAASGLAQNPLEVWQFHTDWSNPSNSTFAESVTLAAASFDSNLCNFNEACIPEPAVSGQATQALDPLSDRLMYRLQYRDFGGYETMVVNHTVAVGDFADHAGIRWYEFRRYGGGSWTIYQQGTYAPDSNHRWMGSMAMDGEGNIALGYSVSSTSVFPSIRYTGRMATDPLNQLPQGEGTIANGTGAQTYTSRWGDYTAMSIDPADDCTFWYTNEYYSTTNGSSNWQTRIGSFILCSPQPGVYYFPVIGKNASLP